VRSSLNKLKADHQRNKQYNSSSSKATRMMGSYVETDKSRNYFIDTKIDPKHNIPTCDYVQFDLSDPMRTKSKQSMQTPFSKTTGASNNATEVNRNKRTRGANSLSVTDKKQYCKFW
jgi:hypothetical protein